jgi:hypothetical protein
LSSGNKAELVARLERIVPVTHCLAGSSGSQRAECTTYLNSTLLLDTDGDIHRYAEKELRRTMPDWDEVDCHIPNCALDAGAALHFSVWVTARSGEKQWLCFHFLMKNGLLRMLGTNAKILKQKAAFSADWKSAFAVSVSLIGSRKAPKNRDRVRYEAVDLLDLSTQPAWAPKDRWRVAHVLIRSCPKGVRAVNVGLHSIGAYSTSRFWRHDGQEVVGENSSFLGFPTGNVGAKFSGARLQFVPACRVAALERAIFTNSERENGVGAGYRVLPYWLKRAQRGKFPADGEVITDVMPTACDFAEYDKRLHGPADTYREEDEEEYSDAESIGSGSSYEMPPGMSVPMDALGRPNVPTDDY